MERSGRGGADFWELLRRSSGGPISFLSFTRVIPLLLGSNGHRSRIVDLGDCQENNSLVKQFGWSQAGVRRSVSTRSLTTSTTSTPKSIPVWQTRRLLSIQAAGKDQSVVLATTKTKKQNKPTSLVHKYVMRKYFCLTAKAVTNQLFEVQLIDNSEVLIRFSSALVQGATNVFWIDIQSNTRRFESLFLYLLEDVALEPTRLNKIPVQVQRDLYLLLSRFIFFYNSVDKLERFLRHFPVFPNAFLVGGPADFFVIELADQVCYDWSKGAENHNPATAKNYIYLHVPQESEVKSKPRISTGGRK